LANAGRIILSKNERRKVESDTADSEKEVAKVVVLSKSVLISVAYQKNYRTKKIV
jgi:hypothetical protein